MIESVSPHRIQRSVFSAQFRIYPAETAARLAPGRSIPSVDFELVHRLGTTYISWSVVDPKTGEMVMFNWSVATVVDSMCLRLAIPAPFAEAYDVTVIG